MSNTFIQNNNENQSMRERVFNLTSSSNELKFLVGFFYFSGWKELYEALKNNPECELKILVGLEVSEYLGNLVEHSNLNGTESNTTLHENFWNSLELSKNLDELDNKEFYEQSFFFLEMAKNGRLKIKKTRNPNHAKLYLFCLNEENKNRWAINGVFITGSSNLTKAGFTDQDEFNIEIKDWGFDEAENYFDQLWEDSVDVFCDSNFTHKLDQIQLNHVISPFEAYVLILKTYLEHFDSSEDKRDLGRFLENINLTPFKYQIDAVNQALEIIEEHNGCIIADVVGLGKSVIASLIAKSLNLRGIIICPPGLVGDKINGDGWHWYKEKFSLDDWEIFSRGSLDKIQHYVNSKKIDVVIVDEAHSFRNNNSATYEILSNICKGKKVILLTATPLNNTPSDIFSLIKLFIIPGSSSLTLDEDLETKFTSIISKFHSISFILRYHADLNKLDKVKRLYSKLCIGPLPVDINKVKAELSSLSRTIKQLVSPIIIRRNRLDLLNDEIYKKEIKNISKVEDPKAVLYELSHELSSFYDDVIKNYFGENGKFKGAIYTPNYYKTGRSFEEEENESDNFKNQMQNNLKNFMRRLLVKRFESSFGSFKSSIDRFIESYEKHLKIINQYGIFILDKQILDKFETLLDYEIDEIDQDIIDKYSNIDDAIRSYDVENIYRISEMLNGKQFINDIKDDLQLFKEIRTKLLKFNIIENDPKLLKLIELIKNLQSQEPKRKIIIFSEYADTVRHMKDKLKNVFGEKILVIEGINQNIRELLDSEFNAQFDGHHKNNISIILATDKLSEGFNLNRAGVIVNFDIPWNPTRVLQRLGRINRIGKKVFDSLYIYNFFPSEVGNDVTHQIEIAREKLFLIHNALGEDVKLFSENETPTPSDILRKVLDSNMGEELSFHTILRNKYQEISHNYPEIIEKISNSKFKNTKTAKHFSKYNLNIVKRKGNNLFFRSFFKSLDERGNEVENYLDLPIEEIFKNVECDYNEKVLKLSENFWNVYPKLKRNSHNGLIRLNNQENYAILNLQSLKILLEKQTNETNLIKFISTVIEDMRNYRTFSRFTINKIARISPNSEQNKFELVQIIKNLYENIGPGYLEKIKSKSDKLDTEVIIAVENIPV